MMVPGNEAISPARLSGTLRDTSVRFPAATLRVSKRSTVPLPSSMRAPIHELALGSVAWTKTESETSTRGLAVCVPAGRGRRFVVRRRQHFPLHGAAGPPPARRILGEPDDHETAGGRLDAERVGV